MALLIAVPIAAASGASLSIHDPSAIKEGEYNYVFSTGPGITLNRTRDFLRWEYIGQVLAPAPGWISREIPGFGGDMWAPDISLVNGRYYLYYAVSTFGENRSCIGLAVNETLDPKSS
jgi:arabinan endo-1,5-alpha-L-arabinosidase